MAGTLKDYKIKKDINIFQENEEKKENVNILNVKKIDSNKKAGRPKKIDTCNKKIILYFTEKEYAQIVEKCQSIAMSPFLKKVVLDSLK